MSSFENQTIASTSNELILEKGKSFVFVSGIGGQDVRHQELSGNWWASIYTSNQNATHGALFCTFNVDGQANKANCYFKDINNQIQDNFTLISNVQPQLTFH